MQHTDWLRAKEAADYMSMHIDTVYPLLQTKKLRSVQVGRTYRIRRQWCDEFLEGGAA